MNKLLKNFFSKEEKEKSSSEQNAFACIAMNDRNCIGSNGLTKREYFAGQAMQGMFSQHGFLLKDAKELAEIAVKCANSLLEALSETKD